MDFLWRKRSLPREHKHPGHSPRKCLVSFLLWIWTWSRRTSSLWANCQCIYPWLGREAPGPLWNVIGYDAHKSTVSDHLLCVIWVSNFGFISVFCGFCYFCRSHIWRFIHLPNRHLHLHVCPCDVAQSNNKGAGCRIGSNTVKLQKN